jgi:hypothetical protein
VLPVVTATLAVVAATSAGALPDPRPGPSSNVHATTLSGRNLPADQLLRLGETVLLRVTGFRARVRVSAMLVPDRRQYRLRSDRSGVAHLRFTVPHLTRPGAHRLTFAGAPHLAHSTRDAPARRDRSAVVATVPRIGRFPFRTGGRGTSAAGTGSDPGTGSMSATGVDILALLAFGMFLATAGAALARDHSLS